MAPHRRKGSEHRDQTLPAHWSRVHRRRSLAWCGSPRQRSVPRSDRRQRGSLSIRWIYGHGFNRGRILVEVRVDGQVVLQQDVAEPSRWQRVTFEIPAGTGSSTVSVAVRASERIEKGWKWGRASTVVAKDLVITLARAEQPESSGPRKLGLPPPLERRARHELTHLGSAAHSEIRLDPSSDWS